MEEVRGMLLEAFDGDGLIARSDPLSVVIIETLDQHYARQIADVRHANQGKYCPPSSDVHRFRQTDDKHSLQ